MTTRPTRQRDDYVDFLRAFSLVVVVIWHWVFTILELSTETVSPSNPIGFTRGMWAITWILQVMPIFFFVGGYTHRLAFDNYEKGTSRRFLKRRNLSLREHLGRLRNANVTSNAIVRASARTTTG